MEKTYIIAEAGVNHNGSLDCAIALVDAAAKTGADAIKFQTFKAEQVVSRYAPKAEYQKKYTNEAESQLEMSRKLELNTKDHCILLDHCHQRGIQFLSSPFDCNSVDLLVHQLDLPRLKIGSGEITNAPLLLKAAYTGKPIILSTGMSSLGEIETALGILAFGYLGAEKMPSIAGFQEAGHSLAGQELLKEKVTLLHCTTEYPTPFHEVNLRAMDTLKIAFGLPVGFSDHTLGITVAIAAVARQAVLIEKHFTLDKDLPGPDQQASLEPKEFKALVDGIRAIESALGSNRKMAFPTEAKNIPIARRSLMANCPIRKGEPFTEANLTTKRPGTGISPLYYWDWLGKTAQKNYHEDEMI